MYRDVTELPETTNCIKIIDDKSLIVYTNDDTSIYKLLSNKYYQTETFEPNTPKTEDVCYTVAEVQTIPSPFDFITPVYYLMAMASFIFIIFVAYKLILHPWWRKK